jgi:hypothetical protein
MKDPLQQLADERYNELVRQADAERLARRAAPKDGQNDMLSAARNVLGNRLVNMGQKLLNDKER